MSINFRKKIKLAKGLSLNLSKTGVSLSVGPKGAKLNIGKKGTFLTTSLPGTGVYSKTKLDKKK